MACNDNLNAYCAVLKFPIDKCRRTYNEVIVLWRRVDIGNMLILKFYNKNILSSDKILKLVVFNRLYVPQAFILVLWGVCACCIHTLYFYSFANFRHFLHNRSLSRLKSCGNRVKIFLNSRSLITQTSIHLVKHLLWFVTTRWSKKYEAHNRIWITVTWFKIFIIVYILIRIY